MAPDPNQATSGVRLDKWLWAARFFKTRPMASEAVKKGHVQLNGQRCKPAKIVTTGDQLRIRKKQQQFIIEIKALSDKRLGAPLARELYAESESSQQTRMEQAENRRLFAAGMQRDAGRPNKKDRRQLIKHKQQS